MRRFSLGARPDGRVIQLEGWAAQPVQLTKVTRQD